MGDLGDAGGLIPVPAAISERASVTLETPSVICTSLSETFRAAASPSPVSFTD